MLRKIGEIIIFKLENNTALKALEEAGFTIVKESDTFTQTTYCIAKEEEDWYSNLQKQKEKETDFGALLSNDPSPADDLAKKVKEQKELLDKLVCNDVVVAETGV